MIGVQQEVNVKVPSENYMIGVQQEVNVKVPSEKIPPSKKTVLLTVYCPRLVHPSVYFKSVYGMYRPAMF